MLRLPAPPDTALTDGRVLLRAYHPADADAQVEAARESTAEVYPWLAWCHPDYARDDAVGWIATATALWGRGDGYAFVITDAHTGRLLGGAGVNQLNAPHAQAHLLGNLGYWVRTSAAGRGVATAAARLLGHWAVTSRGLHRVEILAAVGNVASQRVAAKAGARREGVLRNRLVVGGAPVDAVVYSLVPADFAA